MPRLFRPSIPLRVKYIVAMRQLGEMFPYDVLAANRRGLSGLLADRLGELASLLGCEVGDLRLDHDPALGLRDRAGDGRATVYRPDANDPEFLAYRPHGAQFAGSHDVKTRIRGDRGQFSDVTLIKRERRRQKKADAAKNLKKNPSKWRSGSKFADAKQKIRGGKTKWPKRKFETRKKP